MNFIAKPVDSNPIYPRAPVDCGIAIYIKHSKLCLGVLDVDDNLPHERRVAIRDALIATINAKESV
jgi:hypothetical protein